MVQPTKKIAFELLQRCVLVAAVVSVAGCASSARLPVSAGIGPRPTLPPPSKSLIPLVHVVSAKGWPEGARPVAAEGTAVVAFARGLDHPRWLYVLPNGDVLVAETNAPPRPEDNKGIKGFFFKLFQKKAGGAVPSANRITLLRDGDGDGTAETRSVFLAGLNSPFGMTLVGDDPHSPTVREAEDRVEPEEPPVRSGEPFVRADESFVQSDGEPVRVDGEPVQPGRALGRAGGRLVRPGGELVRMDGSLVLADLDFRLTFPHPRSTMPVSSVREELRPKGGARLRNPTWQDPRS